MTENQKRLIFSSSLSFLLALLGLGPAHLALIALRNDVLALVESGPQLVEEGVVAVVEVAEEGLNGLGGLVGVVEGNAAARLLATIDFNWDV